MAVPIDAGFPPDVHIGGNFTLRFTALNATTGNPDTSVVISDAALLVLNTGEGSLSSDPFIAEELTWLNVPVEDESTV